MSKQTTKQIAFAAIISLLFIFLLAGLIIYHHPTVSHATSTTESGNGKETVVFIVDGSCLLVIEPETAV